MKIKVKILEKYAGMDLIPRRTTADAAGFDLMAAEHVVVPACVHRHVECKECGPVTVHVPGRAVVSNGIAIEIERGFEAQVRPRSGLGRKHGISIVNTPGTIDADYRGEVSVTLINFDGVPFVVNPGDRIAQMVVHELAPVSMEQVDSLSETARGTGGFGSTGR